MQILLSSDFLMSWITSMNRIFLYNSLYFKPCHIQWKFVFFLMSGWQVLFQIFSSSDVRLIVFLYILIFKEAGLDFFVLFYIALT